MRLACSLKKPRAACLINGDAYRRPVCRSLAQSVLGSECVWCRRWESRTHTLRWSTSIMGEINNLHEWVVLLLWKLRTKRMYGRYYLYFCQRKCHRPNLAPFYLCKQTVPCSFIRKLSTRCIFQSYEGRKPAHHSLQLCRLNEKVPSQSEKCNLRGVFFIWSPAVKRFHRANKTMWVGLKLQLKS